MLREGTRYFEYLSLHYNLLERERLPRDGLLDEALEEKIARSRNRVFLLLGLLYPWRDIVAARWAIEHGDARAKSSASEYLDNVLAGHIRRRLMPILDDMPLAERVRKGNVILRDARARRRRNAAAADQRRGRSGVGGGRSTSPAAIG